MPHIFNPTYIVDFSGFSYKSVQQSWQYSIEQRMLLVIPTTQMV